MRRSLFTLSLLLGMLSSLAQTNNDSLWSIWNDHAAVDSSKLEAMHTLAKKNTLFSNPDSAFTLAGMQLRLARSVDNHKYAGEALNTQGIAWAIRGRLDSALTYFESALKVFEDGGLDSETGSALYNIGNVYSKNGDLQKGLEFMEKSLAISKETGNIRGMTRCYHGIGRYHENLGNYNLALKYYKQSLNAHESIDDDQGTVTTLISIAIVHKLRGDYDKAIEILGKALVISEKSNDKMNIGYCLDNIGNIYSRQNEFHRALDYYQRSLLFSKEVSDKEGEMHSAINLAGAYSSLERVDEAIQHYDEALVLAVELNDKKSEGIILNNRANLLLDVGRLDEALQEARRSLKLKEEVGFSKGYSSSNLTIGSVLLEMQRYREALQFSQTALDQARIAGNIGEIQEAAYKLYVLHQALDDQSKALDMFRLHVEMRDSLDSEKNQRAVLRQEYKYSYDKQALADSLEFTKKEAIKDLEIEKRDADLAKQRIGLGAAGGGLLLLGLLAYSIRSGKRRSDELLHNILPEEVAAELKEKGHSEAQLFDATTVLFTDFKGFTSMAEKLSPKELVGDLNHCFSEFDKITTDYGIEKIKTIGDAYMAAGGLPSPTDDHAKKVVLAALAMADFVEEGKQRRMDRNRPYFKVRIGIHTGPVVAGIVGVKKFAYDIWGDTVNTASRMESSGEVGKVNISQSTYELLKDDPGFKFESRGKVEAKGKGEIEMYFVSKREI
jgi:class 3 adenylate cyclase/Tfp pilus assembly protein PilF